MELIRQHLELGRLTKAISKKPQWKSVKHLLKTKTTEHYLLMSAPATAAMAIMKSGLHKRRQGEAQDPAINLLIINAKTIDWIDEGQWYRYLAPMLGWNGELHLTVQTRDRSQHRPSRVVPVLKEKDKISVDVFEGSLHELWKRKSPDDFDTAIWFCPDFSAGAMTNGQGWNRGRPEELSEGGIEPLLQRGTPVFFTSYAESQQMLSLAILECYGYSASSVLDANPFSLISRRDGENWSRTIGKFDGSFSPMESVKEDEGTLLSIATSMVLHSLQNGVANQPNGFGEVVMEGEKQLVHAMDGICLDLRSGEVWQDIGGRRQRWGTLPDAAMIGLKDFDEGWSQADRLLWAACAKQAALANQPVKAA